jgi:hypothetical protein
MLMTLSFAWLVTLGIRIGAQRMRAQVGRLAASPPRA